MPFACRVEVLRGSVCDIETVPLSLGRGSQSLSFGKPSTLWTAKKDYFQRINFDRLQTIFAEVAKQDIEVIVYTSTESILSGKAQRFSPIDADGERTFKQMPRPYCRSKFFPNKKNLRRWREDCQL